MQLSLRSVPSSSAIVSTIRIAINSTSLLQNISPVGHSIVLLFPLSLALSVCQSVCLSGWLAGWRPFSLSLCIILSLSSLVARVALVVLSQANYGHAAEVVARLLDARADAAAVDARNSTERMMAAGAAATGAFERLVAEASEEQREKEKERERGDNI